MPDGKNEGRATVKGLKHYKVRYGFNCGAAGCRLYFDLVTGVVTREYGSDGVETSTSDSGGS